jgi:hypothetical protein
MANFDLSKLALKAVCPANEILYDDKGLPSIMVVIPKFKISDVITGGSDSTHPAFIVNGQEVDQIYISKYENVVNNSRAYSLPGEDPKTNINFDQAIAYCTAKGDGWHLMSRPEYAAIALWCKKNGTMPKGNNNYGKDSTETLYKAIPSMARDSSGRIQRVATGTGPLTWSHDGTVNGAWDFNGNVWEWNGGVRLVYGELQVLVNNNAADLDNSQTAASAQWKAIDATTGAYITPNGTGTTANSIKMDFVSNKITYAVTITNQADASVNCQFKDITAGASIAAAAQDVLKALALLSDGTDTYGSDNVWINNGAAERLFLVGGDWGIGSGSGVFALNGGIPRSIVSSYIGFRSAFCVLPTA